MNFQLSTVKVFLLLGHFKWSEASSHIRGKMDSDNSDRGLLFVNDCNYCHPNAACLDTPSADLFKCVCEEGYDLDPSDNQTCIDRNECMKDAPCSSIGGWCVDHDPDHGFYTCGCLDGFEQTEFDEVMGHPIVCVEKNECLLGNHTCDPNVGLCENTAGGFVCSCPDTYFMNASTHVCTLDEGLVDLPTEDPCSVKNCDSINSFCELEADNVTAVCLCKDGYFQIGRGAACHDIRECDINGGQGDCHENAKCHEHNGGYQCICNSGYNGNGVDCVDANECDIGNHNCEAHLMCVNDDGGYSCVEFPSAAPSLSPSIAPSSSPTQKKRNAFGWVQLGQIFQGGVFGTGNNIDFGRDTSINGAGNMIAVGVNNADDPKCVNSDNGAVYVFKLNGSTQEWQQVGNPITSTTICSPVLQFGYRVELASDGQSVAVSTATSSNGQGFAAVYELVGGDWVRIGNDIFMTNLVEVYDMTFSGDGQTIAVTYLSSIASMQMVEIYHFDAGTTDWILADAFSDADGFLWSLSLSYDRSAFALGGPGYAALGFYNVLTDMYDYTDIALGDCDSTPLFGSSISLSNDGNLLAVGDVGRSRVQVFQKDILGSDIMVQVGQSLVGGPNFGAEVDLDADGNTLAVGSHDAVGGVPGYVTVYTLVNNVWIQLGKTFGDAGNAGFDFGRTVALSDNGRTLATGANNAPTPNGATDGIASVHHYVQI